MAKLICAILLSCLISFGMSAQPDLSSEKRMAIRAYNEALHSYTLNNYARAIELYRKALTIDNQFFEAWLRLAEAYEGARQYDEAISAIESGLSLNPARHPHGYLLKARLELRIGRYHDARGSYQRFLDFGLSDTEYNLRALKGIRRCDFAFLAVANPVPFLPIDLGPNVNTPDDEYWPCLTADESMLVITRRVPDSKAYMSKREDLFFSLRENSRWGIMHNAGPPLNSLDNEGAQTISANGRIMVFTGCNRPDGYGRCDLFYSLKVGEQWSLPKNIGNTVNTRHSETQPSLSADGRTLYFASDRPGGQGRFDLYVSTMNETDEWTTPVNLGDIINTKGDEFSPFIHQDDATLYFSSDEHLGMGGHDIFFSRRDSVGAWDTPVNIGYPINTFGDEIGMIVNARGNMAYYASDINPSMGKDIFSFDLHSEARPIEVSYLKGRVFDIDTRRPLQALFDLVDLENGNTIYQSVSDSLNGEFLLCLPANRDYMLNVSRQGYLFYSDNFSFKGMFAFQEPFIKDVPLSPVKIGQSIVLRNVFYETASFHLRSESMAELERLLGLMVKYPDLRIEVSGHTDNVGSLDFNRSLSENRAQSVAYYLISEGISPQRIVFKGYGFSKPIADNVTEEGRALNRRTEVTIIP